MLVESPMLVGGVEEEDCAFEASSTVRALMVESDDDSRVTSARSVDFGVPPILSSREENRLVIEVEVAFCTPVEWTR